NAVDLFRRVSSALIEYLVPRCEIQRYDQRDMTILRSGAEADALYLVHYGFLKVVHERDPANERVLWYLRAGEYLADASLLDGGGCYASVRTAGRSELIRLPKADFVELCNRFPSVAKALRETIRRRRAQSEQLEPEVSRLLKRSGQLGVIQSHA